MNNKYRSASILTDSLRSTTLQSLVLFGLFFSIQTFSQTEQVTYVIDDSFDTGTTLRARAGITDIIELGDGNLFLKGSIVPAYEGNGPFNNGAAMVQENGSPHPDYINDYVTGYGTELYRHGDHYFYTGYPSLGRITTLGESYYSIHGDAWGDYFKIGEWGAGYQNPYNKRYVEDVFITEDEKVIIAGAIATDTLQPGVYRHLMRLNEDGSHDSTFPVIEGAPQTPFTKFTRIDRTSDGSWFVTGNFSSVNGHETINLAKLHPDFSIDTSFVSPLDYSYAVISLIDEHDRLWITGSSVKLAQFPDETFGVVRIFPNGDLDSSLSASKIKSVYPTSWSGNTTRIIGVKRMNTTEELYLLYGVFNYYNDTLSRSIVTINDQGYVRNNFFNGNGPQYNIGDEDQPEGISYPSISEVVELTDGSMMIGGSFSVFYNESKFNIVKLMPTFTTSTSNISNDQHFQVYPNPSNGVFNIKSTHFKINSIRVFSATGRLVEVVDKTTDKIDLSHLFSGIYIIEIHYDTDKKEILKWIKT